MRVSAACTEQGSTQQMKRTYLTRVFKWFCIVAICVCAVSFCVDLVAVVRMSLPPLRSNGTEARHVVFLKAHKTGSSTVQNIFLRFGETRGLTFVLGAVQHNECGGWPNCISFNNTLNDRNTVPPPRGKEFEILCSHVIYDKSQFVKYLPTDTRYIGLVREPTRRLESAMSWFKEPKGVSLSQYAKDPLAYNHYMLNNRMAVEFGFKKEWLPNKTHPSLQEGELADVTKYVDQIFTDFDLVLVNERLDESLILMKRMLNWKTSDVLYVSKLIRNHDGFSANDKLSIKRYLYLDYFLYERAVKHLEEKITKAGRDLQDEVNHFKHTRSQVQAFCAKRTPSDKLPINGTKWDDSFVINNELCATLMEGEISYTWRIRKNQYSYLWRKKKDNAI